MSVDDDSGGWGYHYDLTEKCALCGKVIKKKIYPADYVCPACRTVYKKAFAGALVGKKKALVGVGRVKKLTVLKPRKINW